MESFSQLKPWLWLPVGVAHALAPTFIRLHGGFRSYKTYSWKTLNWRGLTFANRLGLAAGVDKDATQVKGWWTLGAGFLELGTIVPKPQGPNSGPLVDRDKHNRAIWNRLGFPSCGVKAFKEHLIDLGEGYHTPLLINIGKNRNTSLENASKDYQLLIQELDLFADAFVINISSPNTVGLRSLLNSEYLQDFLGPIVEKRDKIGNTPLLLKLSPDLTESELQFALECSLKMGIDGWVITNTTLQRPGSIQFPKEGGLSGAPLANISKTVLKNTIQMLGSNRDDKLIISAGGIMHPEDVDERIEIGADLVEVYTALIFEGPFFFEKVAEYFTRPT